MAINRANYPPDWEAISKRIRFERAGNCCEWCGAVNYQPHPITGSRVMLTVAHIDHNTQNNDDGNLAALCQRCHLRHDIDQHVKNAALTRRQKRIDAGQLSLF